MIMHIDETSEERSGKESFEPSLTELAWFRRLDKQFPIKSKLGNKELKIKALVEAVERRNVRIRKAAEEVQVDARSGIDSEIIQNGNFSDDDSDADLELGW